MAAKKISLQAQKLTASNWDELAPIGKEVDAILGDYVLRNDFITCVIAAPLESRHANLTMRGVGGYLLDIASNDSKGDQLGYFSPGGRQFTFHDPEKAQLVFIGQGNEDVSAGAGELIEDAIAVELRIDGEMGKDKIPVRQVYRLDRGKKYLHVDSSVINSGDSEVPLLIADAVRADRTFEFGVAEKQNAFWAHDSWFFQAIGIASDELKIIRSERRGIVLEYLGSGTAEDPARTTVIAGESFTWGRKIVPAENSIQLIGLLNEIRGDKSGVPVIVELTDDDGPVIDAQVLFFREGTEIGRGRTSKSGTLKFLTTEGIINCVVSSDGREKSEHEINVEAANSKNEFSIELSTLGRIEFKVADQDGEFIPCKVAFIGVTPTPSPDFGSDSRAEATKNIRYSAAGKFSQRVGPGDYEVLISHGVEYDAQIERVEVKAGENVSVDVTLNHSVSTPGWVSTEYHSHSSPSGDNTSDQRGRVLNLLAEHLEFAPCTEHNRIDSYLPHLKALKSVHRMATCCGMELTGSMLPVNHQNTFPLKHKPRTQNGGGPEIDANPVIQIERLKLWDAGSDKLMQMNHPNLDSGLGRSGHRREGGSRI